MLPFFILFRPENLFYATLGGIKWDNDISRDKWHTLLKI